MNVGDPTKSSQARPDVEGVGYVRSTDDGKDSTTLQEGRGIAKTEVSDEY